jgi:hypothetical protein
VHRSLLVHAAYTPPECLVEDPATGLNRPRDYVKTLEARVAYLESLLQDSRPDVAMDHLHCADQTSNFLAGNAAQDHRDVGPQLQSGGLDFLAFDGASPTDNVDEENIDDLSSEVALLCLSAVGREPQYFGPSCAVSFSRIVSATMGLPKRRGGSQNSVTGLRNHNAEGQRTVSAGFPSASLAATLSQAYFKNIHSQYPFLHQPTYRAWEEICFRAHASDVLESAGDVPLFFVLMVYAIGSLTLGPAHYDAAEAFYDMALKYQETVLDLDGLESIQSILCCAVYSIRSPVGVSLWKISGMAIRHCIELGYHRSVAKFRPHIDPSLAEMSRRCFWVAYDIDRVAAFTLGRPMGIPDDSIDVELPMDLPDEHITRDGITKQPRAANEPSTPMTGAIHTIKLRRLWSKFANTLYPTTTKRVFPHPTTREVLGCDLRQELEEWYAAVPEPLGDSMSSTLSVFASKAWFQLAYDHSILLLYRHYITLTPSFEEQESVSQAFEECVRRSRDMCLLYRHLYQNSSIQLTWGSLHILFLGGITYLYCIWKSSRVRRNAKPSEVISTCMACNAVLVIMAERFKQASTYRDTFEALSEKTINMVCDDMGGPHNAPADTTYNAGSSHDSRSAESQAWIMDLADFSMPAESEWYVQELVQGMSDFSQPGFTFVNG